MGNGRPAPRLFAVLKECRKSRNPYVTIIAKICLATGARWCEAEGLRRSDLAEGRVRYTNTKNGRVRIMPLTRELHAEALSVGQNGDTLFSYSRGAFRSAYRRTGLKTAPAVDSHTAPYLCQPFHHERWQHTGAAKKSRPYRPKNHNALCPPLAGSPCSRSGFLTNRSASGAATDLARH